MKKINGFTLAELLISIGIIGVVASMTIPTLMIKTNNREVVAKLKKMYMTLDSAYQLYLVENKVPEAIEFSKNGAEKLYSMFSPYLNIAQDCGTSFGTCVGTGIYLRKNGAFSPNYNLNSSYYTVVLADGSTLIMRGRESKYLFEIFYDINGASPPNRWGYDLFEFDGIGANVYPAGIPDISEDFDETCAPKNSLGYGCAAWIIYKENMDYLRCDDLTWNKKNECD
ncbi:type II secretion system protein [bacterium]|nr:type II secretion system protein [bacterium]